MKFLFSSSWPVLGLALLAGCGSISTHDLQPTVGPAPQSRPEKILVLPFETADCQWALEVSSTDEALVKSGFPERMAVTFVRDLDQVAPASKTDGNGISKGWLVQGRVHRVMLPDPGLKDSKRKPRVECTVFIFDLDRSRIQPFLTYRIEAKEVTADPMADPAEAGKAEYLELEIRECSRLLTRTLQEYLSSRGWSQTGK